MEAALFMAGKPMKKQELANILNEDYYRVEAVLKELREKYRGPIEIRDTEETVFMTVEEKYLGSLWFLGKGEFTGAELKTLAMVAYYAPVKQSDIVRARGNRAYGHLQKLEEVGLLTSSKFSNTRLIKLSRKFFEYFGEGVVERIRNSPAAPVDEPEGGPAGESVESEKRIRL